VGVILFKYLIITVKGEEQTQKHANYSKQLPQSKNVLKNCEKELNLERNEQSNEGEQKKRKWEGKIERERVQT